MGKTGLNFCRDSLQSFNYSYLAIATDKPSLFKFGKTRTLLYCRFSYDTESILIEAFRLSKELSKIKSHIIENREVLQRNCMSSLSRPHNKQDSFSHSRRPSSRGHTPDFTC